MRAMLFNFGINVQYQVEFCISGYEALEQLKKSIEHGFRYVLIFTDFNMPRMGGIQTTVKIRKYFAHVRQDQPRIVGVTGHVQDEYATQGQIAGMD